MERYHTVAADSVSFGESGCSGGSRVGDTVPNVLVAGSDSLGTSVAMVNRQVQSSYAVATH